MRLYELVQSPDMSVNLAIFVGQMKNDVDNKKIDYEMPVDDFIKRLNLNDIPVTIEDLYTMYQTPPMDSLVSNIKNDENGNKVVVFKGGDDLPADMDQESDQEDIVAGMAKSALNR